MFKAARTGEIQLEGLELGIVTPAKISGTPAVKGNVGITSIIAANLILGRTVVLIAYYRFNSFSEKSFQISSSLKDRKFLFKFNNYMIRVINMLRHIFEFVKSPKQILI